MSDSDEYSKIVNSDGKLINYENARALGLDPTRAHEVVEQMYGMIWLLAKDVADYIVRDWHDNTTPSDVVEDARKRYQTGIKDCSPGKEQES